MERAWLFFDGGTTRTRATAARGEEILFRAVRDVGARDVARAGAAAPLAEAVEALVLEAARACADAGVELAGAVAAGMITSPQGLVEVPHVRAPAGAAELAAGAARRPLGATGLTLHLVPGVRGGPDRASTADVLAVDVMRGEEVLALGCARLGLLPATGGALLSLGSHWKALAVDHSEQARIVGSTSTLSGELVHAVATTTVLASALPRAWPQTLDELSADVLAGARAARAAGLSRALYAVRLLELREPASTPERRLAFTLGAAVAADEDVLVPRGTSAVTVVGSGPALRALSDEDASRAFRAGCLAVLAAAGVA
jgi:2-dehydro-3-deoxygalactonokinase